MNNCECCNKIVNDIRYGLTGKSHTVVLSNGYNYEVNEWGWICEECKNKKYEMY